MARAETYTVLGALTQMCLAFGLQNGVEPEALCDAAGISPAELVDRHAQVARASHYALFTALAKRLQRDSLSVELGRFAASLEHFGYLGLALKTAATPLDALRLLASLARVVDSAFQHAPPQLLVGEGEVELLVSPVQDLTVGREPPEGIESTFVCLVEALRSIDGVITPSEVRFAHGRSRAIQHQLETYFRAPVYFGCDEHTLVWDARVLRCPMVHADRVASHSFALQVKKLLEQQTPRLLREVSRLIRAHVARQDLSQAMIASWLGRSTRTLQRQLRSVGVSYQQVLTEERRALAVRLLAERELAIYQVANAVGYDEASAFNRAFRDWTGVSPSAYRKTAP